MTYSTTNIHSLFTSQKIVKHLINLFLQSTYCKVLANNFSLLLIETFGDWLVIYTLLIAEG